MLVLFSLTAWATNYLVSIELPLAVILSFLFFCPFFSHLSKSTSFSEVKYKVMLLGQMIAGFWTLGCWAQWKRGLQQYLQRKMFISFTCHFCLCEKITRQVNGNPDISNLITHSIKWKQIFLLLKFVNPEEPIEIKMLEIWGFSIFSVSSFKVINSDK